MGITRKVKVTERDRLADEIAGLRADIAVLRKERAATAQATDLERTCKLARP